MKASLWPRWCGGGGRCARPLAGPPCFTAARRRKAKHQSELESGSFVTLCAFPLVIPTPEDAPRMHQVTAIKRPLSAASKQDNTSPRAAAVALLRWEAVNCWHRRRRFVSIKHKHPDVHFSGLNSRQIFQGQPLFLTHPRTFLIYHI